MGERDHAAVRILANERCLASHGLTATDLLDAMNAVGLTAGVTMLAAGEEGLEAGRAELERDPPAVVVAAGGDGTVHQVVNIVAPLGLPLGVLPLGTANDFARALHLPTDLKEAARVIAEEAPIAVDLGRVNGQCFINAAHLGLGVETAKRIDPQLKRWLGPLAYGMAAVQAWREVEPLMLEICADGSCTSIAATQLLVGVGMFFGGGNRLGKASLDTGTFEVFALGPHLGAAHALEIAAAMRMGTLGDQADTLHVRNSRLVVKLSRAAEINLDGELLELGRELDFEVVPGGLSVYAKATTAEVSFDPWHLDVTAEHA